MPFHSHRWCTLVVLTTPAYQREPDVKPRVSDETERSATGYGRLSAFTVLMGRAFLCHPAYGMVCHQSAIPAGVESHLRFEDGTWPRSSLVGGSTFSESVRFARGIIFTLSDHRKCHVNRSMQKRLITLLPTFS